MRAAEFFSYFAVALALRRFEFEPGLFEGHFAAVAIAVAVAIIVGSGRGGFISAFFLYNDVLSFGLCLIGGRVTSHITARNAHCSHSQNGC